MASCLAARLNLNAIRSFGQRRVLSTYNYAAGVRYRAATTRPSLFLSRNASSAIPDDFDIDADVGSTSRPATDAVASNPYPETLPAAVDESGTDWSRSFHGLSATPFPKEVADVLLAPIDPGDIEMKPGTLYALQRNHAK